MRTIHDIFTHDLYVKPARQYVRPIVKQYKVTKSVMGLRSTYYVAHYVWPYHETVRMSVSPSVCLSVTCDISKTEPDRAIVTMDHYIEVGCN